jgi:glycosyltransferase involved in cell wall biosynthesis
MDDGLLATRKWQAIRVDITRQGLRSSARWLASALRSRLALAAVGRAGTDGRIAEEALYRGYNLALGAAIRCRASLYIAHTQSALPIAARAAAHHGVSYAFDCEDLLAEETADGLVATVNRQILLGIERRYFRRASYLSATSQAMADYLIGQYEIPRPTVIHNVFPRASGPDPMSQTIDPVRQDRRMVWVSAVVGPDRGIEDAMSALAHLPDCFTLDIVGRFLPGYRPRLESLATQTGVAHRVCYRDPVDPKDLHHLLSSYDIGLALELSDCANKALTTSNKLFLYLQAGLATVATDTPGQSEVMDTIPDAGFCYKAGDVQALATGLLRYAQPNALITARSAARDAGRDVFCWEKERPVFLELVERALSTFHEPPTGKK